MEKRRPSSLTALGSTVYFAADDGTSSRGSSQLWRSDGTSGGTVPVSGIGPPEGGGFQPTGMTVVGGTLFMVGADGPNGTELFKTSGSSITLVTAIDTDRAGSFPFAITPVSGRTLFAADDGVHGSQLYGTDGTPAGTALVKLINSTGAGIGSLTVLPGGTRAVFPATDGSGPELWVTDGTSGGTQSLKLFSSGVSGGATNMVAVGSQVLFSPTSTRPLAAAATTARFRRA